MASELEKLSIYLGRGGVEVSERDVDAIVSVGREAEAWDLTDAIGERDPVKLARALRQLQSQEESAIRLVAMVESRVRDLMVMRTALDRNWIRARDLYAVEKILPPEADAMLGGLTKDPAD